MLTQGLSYFKNKNVLLLQGPVGPFFWRLSKDLKAHGANVHKVNFNLGDWLFYPFKAFFYKGDIQSWPNYFHQLCKIHQIDHVILFGDCRPIHLSILSLAMDFNIEICVFEEGYIRPNYVTFERYGVNNNSSLSRDPNFYKNQLVNHVEVTKVGSAYWFMIVHGFFYHFFLWVGQFFLRKYQHHREVRFVGIFPWILSVYRKFYYLIIEVKIEQLLVSKYDKNFFLVPLQISSDFQIQVHSDIDSMYNFIQKVIDSFAKKSLKDQLLVIKHHSMDRGHVNYSSYINDLKTRHSLGSRVLYVHDLHLPTLLNHAAGVVLVNSTVGFSSLIHRVPTKVLGRAIYDFEGLTYQGDLDQFWSEAMQAIPDSNLVENFLSYVINKTQVNGSFYKRIKKSGYLSGLIWKSKS